MRRISRMVVLYIPAVLWTACGSDHSSGAAVTVTNDTGVQVAVSNSPLWEVGTGWRIGDVPAVVIATPPAGEFTRVVALLSLPDGRIVAMNGEHP
ncbi:MAG: hypothetical protein ACE5HT_16735, partial [Gemmatimonadales bacterium]